MGYARLLRQRSCRDAPSRSPRETGCVVRARLLPEPGLYAEPRQLPHRAVSAHDAMPPERPVDPRRRTPDIAVARRCRLCLRAFGQAAPVTVPRFGRTGDRAPYRRWLCRVPLVAPSRPGLADQRIWCVAARAGEKLRARAAARISLCPDGHAGRPGPAPLVAADSDPP